MDYQILAGFTVMMLCGVIIMILSIIAIIVLDGRHLEMELLKILDKRIFVNRFWEKSFPLRLLLWAELTVIGFLFFGWFGLVAPVALFVMRPFYAPRILRRCLIKDAHQQWAIDHKVQYDFLKMYPIIALHLATFNPNKVSDQNELKLVKALESVPRSHEKNILKRLKADLIDQGIYPVTK